MVLLIVDACCVLVRVLIESEQMLFTDPARGETIEHVLKYFRKYLRRARSCRVHDCEGAPAGEPIPSRWMGNRTKL